MQVRSLVALGGLAALLVLPQHMIAADDAQVATIEPACPEWKPATAPGQWMIPPTITILYNPKSPGARLRSPQTLNLVLASALFATPFDSTTIPMVRSADGIWQAEFTPKKNRVIGYSIFFFQDEKSRVDNNRGQYWEILYYYHSQVDEWGIGAQASNL